MNSNDYSIVLLYFQIHKYREHTNPLLKEEKFFLPFVNTTLSQTTRVLGRYIMFI